MFKKMKRLFTFILLIGLSKPLLANPPPLVVVSITPFYGLVAAVMEGIGTPQLLVKPGASPHHYALKPSGIQMLKKANVIFWGGPALESFLTKPLNTLASTHPWIVEFDKIPDLYLLPLRQDPTWEPDHHSHGNLTTLDMHFWLDPKNAIVLTKTIVSALSKADPQNKLIYEKNGGKTITRLNILHETIEAKLKNVKTKPYIVFHDAYQYFDNRYDLNGVGAIALHPEIPTSVKRLNTIRQKIEKIDVQCVFTEPQFQPKIVQSIVKDMNIKVGELDPLGADTQNTTETYFLLMERLSDAIKECLDKA